MHPRSLRRTMKFICKIHKYHIDHSKMNQMSQIPLLVLKKLELEKLQNQGIGDVKEYCVKKVKFAKEDSYRNDYDDRDEDGGEDDAEDNAEEVDIEANDVKISDAINKDFRRDPDEDSDKEVEIIKNVIVTKPETKETSDAMIQTDSMHKSKTRNVEVQTDISFMPNEMDYHQFKAYLEQQSLSHYKPMYNIPQAHGNRPPLKIGLTLPKGKKRKVFYPDLENIDENEIENKK